MRAIIPSLLAAAIAATGAAGALAQSASGQGERPAQPPTVDLWQPGDTGERLNIIGRVVDIEGKPIPDALLVVRQADGNGSYHGDRYRARLVTGKDGGYRFSSVIPGQYYGVMHIHVYVSHEQYEALETRILFKGDPNLDADTQRDHAIFLEESLVNGEKRFFGRFDVVLRRAGS